MLYEVAVDSVFGFSTDVLAIRNNSIEAIRDRTMINQSHKIFLSTGENRRLQSSRDLSPYTKIIVVLLSSLLTSLLFSCAEQLPAEEQLLNNLNEAELAIENLDSNKLKDLLASDFDINGPDGSYDFPRIKRTMLAFSLRKQTINIILTNKQVVLDKHNTQLASIESTVLITGSRGLLPEDGKLYQLSTQWRLYKDEWKIVGVAWK